MPVRVRRRLSTSFVVTVVAFFVVSGVAGYLARSFLGERPLPPTDESCAELSVEVAELKRKYLNDLTHYARWNLRKQKIPFVDVTIVRGAVAVKFPTSVSQNDVSAIAPLLNFPLLATGAPALTSQYQKQQITLTPTTAALNERLLPSINGNVEQLKSELATLEVKQFKIESFGQSGILVRVPVQIGRQVFSKRIGAHPIEVSIRFFRSIEVTKVQGQRHKQIHDRAAAGWFGPNHTYHLSRYAIVHEGQLAGVNEMASESGTSLLRLRLQSDAAHRLKLAVDSDPNRKLSLSVHNRVVSTIPASHIDRYGLIDFPVPADSKQIQEVIQDIRLSFAQTALKVVNAGPCG